MLPIPIFVLASGALFVGIRAVRQPEKLSLILMLSDQESTAEESEDNRLPSLLSRAGLQARKELLFSDQRSQQMQEFRSSTNSLNDPAHLDEQAAEEAHLDRHFWVAGTGTVIAATGLLTHTALGPLSIPFTLYTCIPLVQVVYQGIREEKRLRGPVVDLVALGASLSAQYYTLTAFSCMLMCAAEKLVYRTQDRSRRDMLGVFQQQQQMVWLLREGVEIEVLLADLHIGDTIVIHAGGIIPVDGVITQGTASIDQHRLTGEAQPVEKGVGDNVLAATLLLSGRIHVRVEKTGNATITAQIGAVMNEIEDYRERQELRCDETADRLVLPTLSAGALTLARLGRMSAVTVVGANFTETLRIAYPLAALAYLNQAAQQGILIKDGRALEMLSKVDTVIFDKTGTLTLEQPHVAALHPCVDVSAEQLLTYAAAAEFRQSHPIAGAILEADEPQPVLTKRSAELGLPLLANQAVVNVLSPTDCMSFIEQLQQQQHVVCVVGSGVQDALALQKADVSIGVGARVGDRVGDEATAVAASVQIRLTDPTLRQLPELLRLAHAYRRNLRVTAATAFVPSLICLSGAFFLKYGLVNSVFWYCVSTAAGIGNGLLPLLTDRQPSTKISALGDKPKAMPVCENTPSDEVINGSVI